MPGVIVTTNVRSGPSQSTVPSSGQFFMVGVFERGVTGVPVSVRNLPELQRNFGGQTSFSDSWNHAATFLGEGGNQLWVVRVAGPAAAVGTLTLQDRNGTPAPTLRSEER